MHLLRPALPALVLALCAALVTPGAAAYAASAPTPELSLSPTIAAVLPQVIEERGSHVDLRVTTTRATDVTVEVTASDGALSTTPASRTVAVTPGDPDGHGRLRFEVGSSEPGFHSLTFTASAPGADPVSTTLPLLWTPGAPLDGSDSLAAGGPRLYAYQGVSRFRTPDGSLETSRDTAFLNFLDATRVTYQPAVDGRVPCPDARHDTAVNSCDPYHHQARSGLTEIDQTSIGSFTDDTAYLASPYARHQFQRLTYPRRDQRLRGTWAYHAPAMDEGDLHDQRLTLGRGGGFTLVYRYGYRTYHLSGTYRIGALGRLALVSGSGRDRRTTVTSLALGTTPGGHPAAATYGVYLAMVLGPRSGAPSSDGNLLTAR